MNRKNPLILIKHLHDRFEAKGNIECQKSGITLSQFRVLKYLTDHSEKTVTQKELELDFKVSHPSITGIIKRMEEKKLVYTELVKEGIQQKIVHITEEGISALNQMEKNIATDDEAIFKLFKPEEMDQLEDYLSRILEYISK